MIACAGEFELPSEKTFDTLPTSLRGPFGTAGFVDV
jgi:hypothetical protein